MKLTSLARRALPFFVSLAFAAGTTVVHAQDKVIRLAWTPSADVPHIPVALAEELWKSKGLEVSIVTFPSGRESLEALLGGQVDVAAIAEFPAATAALRGQKIGVVANVARYKANRIVTTAATPTLASLASRKLGATVGTNAQFQLETAMAAAGITGTIVNAAPADLLPTLVRKDIDAAAMFPAFFARAKQTLGDQYREIPTPSYVTHFLLVASEGVMKDKPAVLTSFITGFVAAEASIAKNPQAAQQAVVKATNGAVPAAAVAAGWADYDFRVVLQEDLITQINAEAAWILGKGLVKSSQPPAEAIRAIMRPEFLRQAASERVTLK